MLYAVGRINEATDIYKQWLARFPEDPRARHFVASCTGEAVPGRASDDYVRAEFDGFAVTFDDALARLEYRAPELVADEVARRFPAAQAARARAYGSMTRSTRAAARGSAARGCGHGRSAS